MHARSISLATVASLALAAAAEAQTIWYVDADVPYGGDGTSWARATKVLEKALTVAAVGDQVWVAEGTYVPILRTDAADPRSATFFVPQAVAVYGGFDGTEATLAQRAGLFDTTVLTGDLGVASPDLAPWRAFATRRFEVTRSRASSGIDSSGTERGAASPRRAAMASAWAPAVVGRPSETQ